MVALLLSEIKTTICVATCTLTSPELQFSSGRYQPSHIAWTQAERRREGIWFKPQPPSGLGLIPLNMCLCFRYLCRAGIY